MHRRIFPLWPIAAFLALAGCASNGGGETGGLTLPSLPKMPTAADLTPEEPATPVGSATELYARIARGANSCWFAANGPLKRDYIYHAEADAPSRGGKAEIIVHARDPSQPNPRGPKSYRIKIDPDGEQAKVTTENLRMPEVAATEMTADVERWSRGEQGCVGQTTAAGWGPQSPAAAAPAKPDKKKAKASQKPKASAANLKPAAQ